MKNKNWFWGLFLLLSAVFVIASQIGSFGTVGIGTVLATILLVAFFIQSIAERSFFGITISLAFLYMIYWKPFHWIDIAPGILILAAILMSTGFYMLFGKKCCKKWKPCIGSEDSGDNGDYFEQTTEDLDGNNPYAKVSFGASIKYLHGDCLKNGRFIVSFGAMEVFFDQALLDKAGAEIFVDCSLGAMKFFVPRDWQIYDNLHVALGEVKNNTRFAKPTAVSPKLTLVGNVQMGCVEIQYI